MKPADVFIAVLVAIIWGFGFIASRLALDEFSPELMTALRFCIAAVPCLFVRKPDVSWPVLIAISFSLFLGQFLAQSYAIAAGVPVGLSSVIVQSQALFTIGFAALLFHERPGAWQTVGIGVATVGLLMGPTIFRFFRGSQYDRPTLLELRNWEFGINDLQPARSPWPTMRGRKPNYAWQCAQRGRAFPPLDGWRFRRRTAV